MSHIHKSWRHCLSLSLCIALSIAIAWVSSSAQKAQPNDDEAATKSSFENAGLEALLKWAGNEVGAGFLVSASTEASVADKRVSFSPQSASTKGEKRVVLYDALREIGLVPMPLQGVTSETYRVVPIREAAQYGEVAKDIEELAGYYFGTLTLRASHVPFEQLEKLVRGLVSKDAVIVAVKETNVLIVSDFIDGLRAAWVGSREADIPTLRADDIVSTAYPCEKHLPETLARAINAAKQSGESYSATTTSSAHVVLLSGRRADVEQALRRIELLEKNAEVREAKLPLHVVNPVRLTCDDLQTALVSFFAKEVGNEQMRFSAVRNRDQVLVAASEADFARVKAVLPEIDRDARSETEAARAKRVDNERGILPANDTDKAKD
ncbi:MAG: hypothetical protein KDB07_06360 [Planctomycetes bacterium]|nr:hypothetical protein [Planctomycetota bacterium]